MNTATFDVHARDFIASCMRGELDAARDILARHPELIDSRNNTAEKPLHYLAIENCVAGVELLIGAGAAVEITGTCHQTTPLYDAAGLGLVEMARLLIANGANANRRQTFIMETPLHAAARNAPNAEIIAVLLEAGADIEARDDLQSTPLHAAVSGNNVVTARALLERGASRVAVDEFGETAADNLGNDSPEELAVLLRGAR